MKGKRMEMQSKNFKVKVSESCKNGARLLPDKKFAPNQVVSLTASEFFSQPIQISLQKNIITVEERPSNYEDEGKLYRSIYDKTMNVPQIGLKINPNQVFFISKENLSNEVVNRMINNKWIIAEKEQQTTVKTEEKTNIVKEEPKTVKKVSKPRAKQVKQTEKLKVKGSENIPKNMHVHIPENIKPDVEIKKIPKVEGIIDIMEDSEEETISFVDKEQSQQRKIKSNIVNNEEVE
jgi:hypothetical protein